jgi:hypothetical protein
MTRSVNIDTLAKILRDSGWKESVIQLLIVPPVPKMIRVGDCTYLVK